MPQSRKEKKNGTDFSFSEFVSTEGEESLYQPKEKRVLVGITRRVETVVVERK